ncbi:MAG: hypothetical protein E7158_01430 [Firmicutes bacterium]|nr:hypothetical protein [Bacillota bacterium]
MIIKHFKAFFLDVKYDFIHFFDDIHKFLNKFLDDQFLFVFGVALIAIIVVILFVNFSTGGKH